MREGIGKGEIGFYKYVKFFILVLEVVLKFFLERKRKYIRYRKCL